MLLRYGNHDDPEQIIFYLELERKWQETEMTTPSPSFLVTKSIPEVVAIVANTSTVAEVIDVPRAMKDELLHKESRMTQIQNMRYKFLTWNQALCFTIHSLFLLICNL